MNSQYFHHPLRFPGNVPGPFYTTGHHCAGETKFRGMMADCLQCEAPEAEAPDLLASLTKNNLNTYCVRQPLTHDEVDQACRAERVCCMSALRYGGTDVTIIERLGNTPEFCDFIIDEDGRLRRTVDDNGYLYPFARRMIGHYRGEVS